MRGQSYGRRAMDGVADTGDQMEAAVLSRLLALHPVRVTLAELVREVCGERPAFAQRDGCERAVRDLAAVGLLRHDGESVIPTWAALRFDALVM